MINRRKFLKNTGWIAAGTVAAPYILPSGRLFAATGSRTVDHVVFVLFAGGVRQLESIDKAEGNLMPFSFTGNESISPDILGAMSPLPTPTGTRLMQRGTLFKNFRYSQGPTGHFNGHTTAITGRYTTTDIQLRQPPAFPTIFEYYRKHTSPSQSSLNCWWVTDSLGPYPQLNFSKYPGYGAAYGANYIQPLSLINIDSYQLLGNPKTFQGAAKDRTIELNEFFNKQFKSKSGGSQNVITNTLEEQEVLQDFIYEMYQLALSGGFTNPWGTGTLNNDQLNLFTAGKVIQKFKPELLVVNLQGIDVAHTNFSQYCNNIRRADFALSKLWETIQSTPGMANNTVMLVAPEHGRNLEHNTIIDTNGRYALDHTNDEMSRRIFCMLIGPQNAIKQNNVIDDIMGESIDIVPTISHLLGFRQSIPNGMLPGKVLEAALA